MTTAQALLVTGSYAEVQQSPENYSSLFYHRLLQQHPFARVLFPDDMTHQIEVFRKTVDALVGNLADLSAMHPALVALAQRHVAYGVKAKHYAMVGDVLIDTFAVILGDRFTSDARLAWEAVYATTAGIMIDAAYPEHPQ